VRLKPAHFLPNDVADPAFFFLSFFYFLFFFSFFFPKTEKVCGKPPQD